MKKLAERFLTDLLGLSWAEAHHEAGKWEHVMSDTVEAALDRVLGNPTTCPHGNPIPGSSYDAPSMVPLADIPVGHAFTVSRISIPRTSSTRRAFIVSPRATIRLARRTRKRLTRSRMALNLASVSVR